MSDRINFDLKEHNGQLDLDNFIDIIDSFQHDSIDYLYDLEPQSQNLFWAGYFCESSSGEKVEKAFYNAAYRIRKISIPMPSMEVDQNNTLRAPLFKSASFSQEITIDWTEDVYHSVKKYHLDWFARWYNRQYDVLRCGISGKFRKLLVVAFHYVDDSESLLSQPKIQPILAFHIGGLIPIQIPELTFDYANGQNDAPVSIKYKCSKIQMSYSKEIGLGRNANIWGDAASVSSAALKDAKVWNPSGFLQDPYGPGDNELEKLRITRSATSYQPSEGAIG